MIINNADLLRLCIEFSLEQGYTKKTEDIQLAPEISEQAPDVIQNIFNDLADYYETVECQNIDLGNYLSWCVLAGIGAAKLWEERGADFIKTGIYQILTSERPIILLDEHVGGLVGNPPGSDGFIKMEETAKNMANEGFYYAWSQGIDDHDTGMKQLAELGIALYLYGAVYEMEQLGR